MKNALNKTYKGFTIIEVMIVLAIAGLIMVIVFFAVPQLQRNQRDNARQSATNRLSAELTTFAGNNQGRYPFATTAPFNLATFRTNYIDPPSAGAPPRVKIENPRTGAQYTFRFAANDGDNPAATEIIIHRGATCNGEAATGTTGTGTERQFALRVELDRTSTRYCVDNGN